EFETLKVLQQSSTSKESIQQKSSKYKKYTKWICNCNRTITKQCIKRQFNRSKTTIEEHICYPWLRRLFFHLSNYFPNLHTTRSSRNYRSQTSTSSSSTVINRRQNKNLPLNKNINTYIYKSPTRLYKENDSQQLHKHNTIECINSIKRIQALETIYGSVHINKKLTNILTFPKNCSQFFILKIFDFLPINNMGLETSDSFQTLM
ncbi:unnamed protein product, partial [Schistosoma curassoni]|uniref:Uncharacterized protein n=1 Tax=Schistosoma curassoni TaxID=6186 RepID=A0A183KJL7_9TREM